MPYNLAASFDYFEALFHNTKENTVLLIDAVGIITAVNTAFSECFGYTESDIMGEHFSILFTEEDKKSGKPENELKTVLRTGQCSDNNYLVQKDKDIIWVSGESLLVKNKEGGVSILKVIQNIQKQKTSEQALERSTDFNESILRSIEEAVIVMDDQLQIMQSNKAFNAIFRTDIPDASTLNFAEIIKPHDINSNLLNNVQNVIKNRRSFTNVQIAIDFPSGDKRIFDVSCIPLQNTENGNVVLVMHDITIHKQMEREREDIIGFVAHELRNPIASIILCNQMVQQYSDEGNTEKVNYFLQRGNNNITRLNKMIAELYEATKLQSGNLALEITEFDFPDMVKEAKETIEALYPAFTIAIRNNEDVFIKADRYRLIQVITNYLNNAIKYSAGKKHIEIIITKQPGNVQLAVKDYGLGISKLHLPFIFDRFFRAEKVKNMEGIGLGLFLCRQIIQAHKGKVWAESVEGEGSVFYFSIPV